MPPPEIHKVKSGVSLQCARSILVHTFHYLRLKNRLYRLHPGKATTYILLHVVPVTPHTHDRLKSIGKNGTKKRKKGEKRMYRCDDN